MEPVEPEGAVGGPWWCGASSMRGMAHLGESPASRAGTRGSGDRGDGEPPRVPAAFPQKATWARPVKTWTGPRSRL